MVTSCYLSKFDAVKIRKERGLIVMDFQESGNTCTSLILTFTTDFVEANMSACDELRSFLESARQEIELNSTSVRKEG